jgi:1-deoxy-D-xylulose-5-phosphate synthase
MVATAAAYDAGPIAFRYPRGEGTGEALPPPGETLAIGRGRVLREGTRVALVNLGTRLGECRKAADELDRLGHSTTLADMRFLKPLDADLLFRLVREHEAIVAIEEGSLGGFGAHVLQCLAQAGMLDGGLRIRTLALPDRIIEHDTQPRQYAEAGLDAPAIVAAALSALGVATDAADRPPA